MNCCICGVSVNKGYYCLRCYNEFKHDIIGKAEWVKALRLSEIRERRYMPGVIFIYLGDDYDIDIDGNLVF